VTDHTAFVLAASLALDDDVDTRAPGGEVTVALCGHWEHEGACRWPHHSSIDAEASPARLRTVVAAPENERAEVVQRVAQSLDGDRRWEVLKFDVVAIEDNEQELARNLAADLDASRSARGDDADDQGQRPQ
jgi:hypothetical protein